MSTGSKRLEPRHQRTRCGLCARSKPLQRSHIVPEHAYAPIYEMNGVHRLSAFDPLRPSDDWTLQKGVRERLLCRDCEQSLARNYEDRVKRIWFDERPLAVLETRDSAVLSIREPERFKLYHLSILLRADLAMGPNWSEVNLDRRHRARLIEMVRGVDPGEPYEFPIVCHAIQRSAADPTIWWDFIAPPIRAEGYGVCTYQFTFGGCSWWYFDTRHPVPEILCRALRPDGTLPVVKRDWQGIEYYAPRAILD